MLDVEGYRHEPLTEWRREMSARGGRGVPPIVIMRDGSVYIGVISWHGVEADIICLLAGRLGIMVTDAEIRGLVVERGGEPWEAEEFIKRFSAEAERVGYLVRRRRGWTRMEAK